MSGIQASKAFIKRSPQQIHLHVCMFSLSLYVQCIYHLNYGPVIPPGASQAFREHPPILYVYVSPLIRFLSCLQTARHLEKCPFHGKESCYSPHLPRPTDSTLAPRVYIDQECKQCCANRERDERTFILFYFIF